MVKDKISLFREGLFFARQEGIDRVAFAHEFDFSDNELLEISGVKKCPRCNSNQIECIDGHIVCLECEWEYK